jgi:hypothetical protein
MLASERPATLPPTIMTLKGDFSDIFVLVHLERGMMVNVFGEKGVQVSQNKHGHITNI